MKAVKNILVPVDFSENAKAAFEYAVALAQEFHAESVKALYIYDDYMPSAPLADPLIIPSAKSEDDLIEDLEKFIGEEKKQLSNTLSQNNVNIKTQATFGLPVETIVMLSETGDYDLIVMGTTGKKNTGEIWFGSTATSVSQKADCPVLLIPSGATYKGVKDMIYACDFDHKSTKHINIVADIAKTLRSDVELVFVKTLENASSHYVTDAKQMRQAFQEQAPEVSFTAHVIEEDSVVEGVNNFAQKAGANLVTIVTKYRSFWQRFVHSSMTKQLAMYSEIPVLVIHAEA